ncbi:C1 family peptidase [Peptoclostridium acidaminophilum]|nr:C1 family peptidase [Peptoclostridium acidaminophilum]
MMIFFTIHALFVMLSSGASFAEDTPYKTGLNEGYIEEKSKLLQRALDEEFVGEDILPSSIDHSDSPYLPPAGSQRENSCVGWAVGYYLRTYQQGMDFEWSVKSGIDYYPSRVFSPTFIYNQINYGVDAGATLEDAGRLLENVGAATLEDFPYIQGDYRTKPSSDVISSAYPHRIRDWHILYNRYDSKEYIMRKTKEYLNTGDILVAGVYVGDNWYNPDIQADGTSIITKEVCPRAGHAITVVGYDDGIATSDGPGAFKVINSWGSEWGDQGFSYVSYEEFSSNIIKAVVYTDIANESLSQEKPDESLYEEIYPKVSSSAAPDKEWVITFSDEVDEATLGDGIHVIQSSPCGII